MNNIETAIITAFITSLIWIFIWMIEYAEKVRIIKLYEKSYLENGIRCVVLADPFIAGMGVSLSQMTYKKYQLKNGELKLDQPNNQK